MTNNPAPADPQQPSPARLRIAIWAIGVLGVLTLLLWALYYFPIMYWQDVPLSDRLRVEAVNGARGAIGVTFAALLALCSAGATVYTSGRNQRAANERHEGSLRSGAEDTRRQIHAQLAVSRDEQFIRSVELLGNPDGSVRVGALYALQSISSHDRQRRQVVVDVLCAYLRHDATTAQPPGGLDPVPTPDPAEVPDSELPPSPGQLVREHAIRVLIDQIPDVAEPADDLEPVRVNFDGAHLGLFELSGKRLQLSARGADFAGGFRLINCDLYSKLDLREVGTTGVQILERTRLQGNLDLRRAVIRGRKAPIELATVKVADIDMRGVERPDGNKNGGPILKLVSCDVAGTLRAPQALSSLTLEDSVFHRGVDLSETHLESWVSLIKSRFNAGLDLTGDALSVPPKSVVITGATFGPSPDPHLPAAWRRSVRAGAEHLVGPPRAGHRRASGAAGG